MDAPFDLLPEIARRRIEGIEKAFLAVSDVEPLLKKAAMLEKFFGGLERNRLFSFLIEKATPEVEEFLNQWYVRDQEWIDGATRTFMAEAAETRTAAVAQHLCSAFGKKLPADFQLSQNDMAALAERARFAARSTAKTFNSKIPTWIRQVENEYRETHGGSLKGMNRWVYVKRMGGKVHAFNKRQSKLAATTEFNSQWTEETASFWGVAGAGLELEAQILPESASDPAADTPIICASFAGQWFPMDEAVSLSYQHPACVHHPGRTRIKSGTIPSYVPIGVMSYGLANLKNC